MTKEIAFSEVPNFSKIVERVRAFNPNIEFVKAELNGIPGTYIFRLRLQRTMSSDLPLSAELVDDLAGKNTDHRYAQLDMKIRRAIDGLQ